MPAPFHRYDVPGGSFVYLSRDSVTSFAPDKFNGASVTRVSLSNGTQVIVDYNVVDFLNDLQRHDEQDED